MGVQILSTIKQWTTDKLVFFGPGLLLAVTAAGESGLTEGIEIGAHYGLALLWVVLLTLMFKYAFTNGIARYTLATGQTIFEGLHTLPGPPHWGSYLIIAVYLFDMFAVGAMLMFAAIFLDYLLPGVYSVFIIAVFLLMGSLTILKTRLLHYFETIVFILVLILVLAITVSLLNFPFSADLLYQGLIPSFPIGSELAILAIIGVFGSGLNLMLYSVWLNQKTGNYFTKNDISDSYQKESFFKRYISSVNIDVLVGFFCVLIITIGFMSLGYAGHTISFMPHGAKLTLDTLITQTVYLLNEIPYGDMIFLIPVFFIFIGAFLVSMDARAKALVSVISRLRLDNNKPKIDDSLLYSRLLIIFILIVISSFLFFNPMFIIRSIAAISAISFGLFGFIVMYLDMNLPTYAKGSRPWLVIMGIGSTVSIYVAFRIESAFLENGVPLIERMVVILLILMIFKKTDLFKKLVRGVADISDKIWTILIFGSLSIYGTFRGLSSEVMNYQLFYNFADIGPMIAGLIGGPFIGVGAGLIGCVYRLMVDGNMTVSSSISLIFTGLIAGIAIRQWKGKITIVRAVILALFIECFNIFSIFSITEILIGKMRSIEILAIVAQTIVPMIVVNTIGIVFFAYLVKDVKEFASGRGKEDE